MLSMTSGGLLRPAGTGDLNLAHRLDRGEIQVEIRQKGKAGQIPPTFSLTFTGENDTLGKRECFPPVCVSGPCSLLSVTGSERFTSFSRVRRTHVMGRRRAVAS